jgi:hypothetical protein
MSTFMNISRGCVVLALLLSACATDKGAEIKVETLVDPKANMSGYKSYAWLDQAGAVMDPKQAWVPVGFDVMQELQHLTDEQLRQRGYEFANSHADAPAAAPGPDLLASFLIVVDMEAQKEEIQKRYGEAADLTNLHEGGLVIALIDPDSGKAVWAGTALAQVKPNRTDAEAKERLKLAVAKIFETFPVEKK